MNSEFRRNLVLELSLARFIGMPAFLFIIFLFAYAANDDAPLRAVSVAAAVLFTAIVLVWGSKQAAESLSEEVNQKTWDIQKMSAISPWSLAWGKILGSTLYNWYGGMICLLVFSFTTPERYLLPLVWRYAFTIGLVTHCLSFFISLLSIQRKQGQQAARAGNIGFLVFVLFVIIPLLLGIPKALEQDIYWYESRYQLVSFTFVSLLIICFWVAVGIWRSLAQELQIRTVPWLWCIFVVFLTYYLTGFLFQKYPFSSLSLVSSLALVGFMIAVIGAHQLLFIDEQAPVWVRRVHQAYVKKQWSRLLQELPVWLVSTFVALPFLLFSVATVTSEKTPQLNLFPIVIFILLLRDICIFLFIGFGTNLKRLLGLKLLYLITVYGVLPGMFNAMGAATLMAIIFPIAGKGMIVGVLVSMVHLIIAATILYRRWQKHVLRTENS